jgi:hypothetical protein
MNPGTATMHTRKYWAQSVLVARSMIGGLFQSRRRIEVEEAMGVEEENANFRRAELWIVEAAAEAEEEEHSHTHTMH